MHLTPSLLSHHHPLPHRAVIAAISSGGEGAVECPPHPNDLNPIIFVDHDKRNKVSERDNDACDHLSLSDPASSLCHCRDSSHHPAALYCDYEAVQAML